MTEPAPLPRDANTETVSTESVAPSPYERVIGRYALCSAFARGGMATVHLARQVSDEGFSRVVAVKRLHAHVAESPESLAMFLDEARLASRIRHSNVVPTLDVVSRDGELLIVMEYVLGDSLSGLVRATAKKGDTIPIPIAVRIAIDMLHGLHAAHEAKDEKGEPLGIVHRDVSPQNVLVGIDGVPRIVDFGIAKAAGRIQTTQNNKLKGKLAYMAPEQLQRTATLDKRVDVYAVSIVLWEMLTMKRLFRGEDEIDTFEKALKFDVPPPSAHNPFVTEELDTVVMHGLQRERDLRPATARRLASELEALGIAASTASLADWVSETADNSLGEARQRFANLEKAPPPIIGEDLSSQPSWKEGSVRAQVESALAQSEAETDVIEGETGSPITFSGAAPAGSSRRKVWRIILPAVAALILVFLFLALGPRSGHSPAPSSAVTPAPPAPVNEAETPQAESKKGDEADTATEGQADDSAEPLAEPEETQGEEDVPSSVKEKTAPRPLRPRSAPRPAARPKDDCQNPFTVDKDGVKIPKVHCL